MGVYLTNTLEEAFKKSEQLAGFNKYIVDEANAAAEVKKEKPIMVVLGNPPYAGYSANDSEWINELIDVYRKVDGHSLGESKVWLKNDYVKFIRFGQWRIERTGKGILTFITDHSYIDNTTFRGLRQNIINTFSTIYILDLHGDQKRKERTPDGDKDENVFDIKEGVSIAFFIKDPDKNGPAVVYHADVWGLRQAKYDYLWATSIATTSWTTVEFSSPSYLLRGADNQYKQEYEEAWSTNIIFTLGSTGIQTSRDELAFDFPKRIL